MKKVFRFALIAAILFSGLAFLNGQVTGKYHGFTGDRYWDNDGIFKTDNTVWSFGASNGIKLAYSNSLFSTLAVDSSGQTVLTEGVFKQAYDAAAYYTITQADTGGVTFASVSDGTAGFTFSQAVTLTSQPILSSLTASKPVFTDASKGLVSTGTLGADQGGTGQSSYAVGDLLYASGATALSKLADVAAGSLLRSGGVTTAPAWTTATFPATTTINQILYSSAANTVGGLATGNSGVLVTSSGGVPSIATDIPTAVTIGTAYVYRASGTDVAVADGGTGLSSYAIGDIVHATATGTLAGLPDVATGSILVSGGVGTVSAWSSSPTINGVTTVNVTGVDGSTVRALIGAMTTPATFASGNAVGVRGSVTMGAAVTGGYLYGAQGKAITGAFAFSGTALAGLYGQIDVSGGTISSGHVAAIQGNIYGANSGNIPMTGLYIEHAGGGVIDSLIEVFGKSDYVFRIASNTHTQVSTTGTALGNGGKGWLKIIVDGVVRYIPLIDVVS